MNRVGRPNGEKNTRHFLRDWREHLNLSQAQLAERVPNRAGDDSLDPTRISKLERGKEKLTEGMIYALAEAMAIEPGWLFVSPAAVTLGNETAALIQRLPVEKHAKVKQAVLALLDVA
jgi:transcriptional regulator with XRE-family HTH domain